MKQISQERKRIKEIFSSMLEALIQRRQLMKKIKSKHTISISDAKDLQHRFFWYIDNPDYKRVNDGQQELHKGEKKGVSDLQ